MDKVSPKCPYCGAEMERVGFYDGWDGSDVVSALYRCDDCGACSPETRPDKAYAAAMRRYQPENEALDK